MQRGFRTMIVERRARAGLVAALVAATAGVALAADTPAPAQDGASLNAVIAPLATRSLLLDVQAVPGSTALVAVGERGHVLESADGGATWTQRPAPTRANLTAVYFVDARHGWAVGHDEVILRTTDGGATWTRTHFDPSKQQPLMDVWFADANTGFAVGAFSTVYRTTDGGATWTAVPFAPAPLAKPASANKAGANHAAEDLGDEEELDQPHLNAIVGASGTAAAAPATATAPGGATGTSAAPARLYIAAEAGRLYGSVDGGTTWRQLRSPYEGSFFGLLPLEGTSLLAFGLRGHLFRSDDAGETWTKLDSGTTALLSGGTRLADGTIVIAGMAGTVVVSRDGGRTFRVHQEADRKGLAAAAPGANGGVVLVGEAGVRTLGADVLTR
jgi:photosystem II stability/assembly factor-like uncharacterized protein